LANTETDILKGYLGCYSEDNLGSSVPLPKCRADSVFWYLNSTNIKECNLAIFWCNRELGKWKLYFWLCCIV